MCRAMNLLVSPKFLISRFRSEIVYSRCLGGIVISLAGYYFGTLTHHVLTGCNCY